GPMVRGSRARARRGPRGRAGPVLFGAAGLPQGMLRIALASFQQVTGPQGRGERGAVFRPARVRSSGVAITSASTARCNDAEHAFAVGPRPCRKSKAFKSFKGCQVSPNL